MISPEFPIETSIDGGLSHYDVWGRQLLSQGGRTLPGTPAWRRKSRGGSVDAILGGSGPWEIDALNGKQSSTTGSFALFMITGFTYIYIYISRSMFISISTSTSISISISISIYISIYIYIYISIYIYIFIYISIYISIYLSINLSIYLSVHLSF